MEWTVFWIDDKTLLIRATTTAFAQTLRIGFDQSPLFMVRFMYGNAVQQYLIIICFFVGYWICSREHYVNKFYFSGEVS